MTVELRPLGVTCNLHCTYCYQNPVRDAQNFATRYNVDKMIEEVKKVNQPFNLFGGEALLVPKEDLERFWKYGFETYGRNGIQTNATLIDDDHIRLFKKYNVFVGISIDGPNELNDLRLVGNGSLEKTREMTDLIQRNIVKLKQSNVGCSVIITLHKLNGSRENLPRLMKFIEWLAEQGITSGNMHTLEVDDVVTAQRYCLTPEEDAEAFLTLAKFFEERPELRWKPFEEISGILSADDKSSLCVWNNCDPLNTKAVYGIEGNGSLTNCTRTNKDGIELYKAEDSGYERYISLYYTPQELGGCQGCPFWTTCGGNCPGESQERDWRNKTMHCKTMKTMLGFYEKRLEEQGIRPVSKHPRLKEIEEKIVDRMKRGQLMSLGRAIYEVENTPAPTEFKVYREGVRVL